MTSDLSKSCCPLAHWEPVLVLPAKGELWADVCPAHGHRVGSEVLLRYSVRDAPAPEAPVQAA